MAAEFPRSVGHHLTTVYSKEPGGPVLNWPFKFENRRHPQTPIASIQGHPVQEMGLLSWKTGPSQLKANFRHIMLLSRVITQIKEHYEKNADSLDPDSNRAAGIVRNNRPG
jgi:hypothetical protein